MLSDTMHTSKELIPLIKYSPKRKTMLDLKDNIEEETCNGEEKVSVIVKFCPKRWTMKAGCYKCILDNYASLFKVWDTCPESKRDIDTKACILGCQAQMETFQFFLRTLVVFQSHSQLQSSSAHDWRGEKSSEEPWDL